VTCNAEGRDFGSVAREIEQGVRGLTFAQGYHPEFLGEYAARQESQRQLLLLAGLAVLGILVLLHVEFRTWRLTLLVFLTLPFALIGGVAGAFLTGGILSPRRGTQGHGPSPGGAGCVRRRDCCPPGKRSGEDRKYSRRWAIYTKPQDPT
jgi:hypothetical protein